jgi:hypothetical protein
MIKRRMNMKMAIKTIKKIVFEVTTEEMSKKGFDHIWDTIRSEYPERSYDLHTIEGTKDEDVVFFELTPKCA